MIDYTQSFNDFASSLGPTDIALYAGAALVAWVLFKDKLNPVTKMIADFVAKFKAPGNTTTSTVSVVKTDVSSLFGSKNNKEDVFFQLVSSWKQTRDLAIKSGCDEAVKVADQMFPYLSPQACRGEKS